MSGSWLVKPYESALNAMLSNILLDLCMTVCVSPKLIWHLEDQLFIDLNPIIMFCYEWIFMQMFKAVMNYCIDADKCLYCHYHNNKNKDCNILQLTEQWCFWISVRIKFDELVSMNLCYTKLLYITSRCIALDLQ